MKKVLLFAALIILLILGIFGYLFRSLFLSGFDNFRENFKEKSYADIFLGGQKIYINLNIAKRDATEAQLFFQHLGQLEVLKKASFELDKDTTAEVSKFLPMKLTVYFTKNNLTFRSRQPILLKSFKNGQKYELATGSAKGTLILNSDRDFNLEIDNPAPLISFATESGKLNFSKKLKQLFPILIKIDKIYLKVNGQNIEGKIELKES